MKQFFYRVRRGRALALLLTLCMVFSLIPESLVSATESGTTSMCSLRFSASDLENADITYQLGTESKIALDAKTADDGGAIWVKDIANNTAITIQVVPKEGSQISGVNVKEDSSKGSEAYQGNCTPNEDGSYTYTFTASGGKTYYVVLSTGNDTPGGEPASTGNVLIETTEAQNGKVFYSLDGQNWTEITATPFTLRTSNELNGVTTGTKIYLKAEPNNGKAFDDYKDSTQNDSQGNPLTNNTISVQSGATSTVTNIDTTALQAGTFAIDYDAAKAYTVNIRFAGNNGGGESSSVNISLDDTVLMHDGKLTDAYATFEGVSSGKIVIEEENDWGCPQMTFKKGYDGGGKILKIEGKQSILMVFDSGVTKLAGIELGENTNLDVDANGAELELTTGIYASDSAKPAGKIRFTNNLLLKIGTESAPVDKAFSGIETITLENFEFHSRDDVNTVIYANTAFDNVKEVDIICSNVGVNATTIFERTNENDTTDCVVKTEGQINLKGAIGDGMLKSTYYFQYPDGPVDNNDMDQSCNVPSCMKTYTVKDNELTTGIGASNSLDPGCILTVNATNDLTFTSTDPILYSVSYQVDDGIEFPNPHSGAVAMKGFDKGFYVVDGTGGRFEAWIAAGETVNVTILPEVGYQYQKDTLNINGVPIENTTPGEQRGTYSFVMPANAGHICAGFAKTEDIISVDDNNIASATIENAENVIENGNVKLEISDATVSTEELAKLEAAAGDYTIADTLEVDLSETVIKNYDPKNATQSSWDTELHELNVSVTIGVVLNETLSDGESYEVLREHNGVVQVLPATYDENTKKLSFETDRFSTYAITYKKATKHTHDYGTVWKSDATNHWKECACKDKSGVAVHAFVWKIDKEATVEAAGSKHEECSVCGYKRAAVEIPKLESKPVSEPEKGTSIKGEKGDQYVVTDPITKEVSYTAPTDDVKGTVEIPSSVTSDGITYNVTAIEKGAFKDKKKVTSVKIGANITSIGANAFEGCTKLKKVTVGSNVMEIGANAFKKCTALTKVTLPAKTTKIGANAFNGCKKLKTITIKSKNLTSKSVAKNAFKGLTKATTIKVPKNKVSAYKKLFKKKGLSSKVKVKKM